jgi:hypothetical protein
LIIGKILPNLHLLMYHQGTRRSKLATAGFSVLYNRLITISNISLVFFFITPAYVIIISYKAGNELIYCLIFPFAKNNYV